MSEFGTPDFKDDSKFLEDEEKRQSGQGLRANYFKPKEKSESPNKNFVNKIRILPPKKGGKGRYYLAGAKHFLRFSDSEKTEVITCMQHTYGEKCIICEKLWELKKEKAPEETLKKFRPKKSGLLNVVDRKEIEKGVQLYECTRATVLVPIVAYNKQGKSLFDSDDGPGRDILISYDKSSKPQSMYMVYPDDPTPLGRPEEVAAWAKEMVDLDPDRFYPRLSEDEQWVLAFGEKDDRDAVREEVQKRMHPEEEGQEEEGETVANDTEDTKETAPEATAEADDEEDVPDFVKEAKKAEKKEKAPAKKEKSEDKPKPKPAEKKESKPEPKPEPKSESKEPAKKSGSSYEDVMKKVNKVRNRSKDKS